MYDGPRPFQPMPSDLTSEATMSLKLEACATGADNQTFRFCKRKKREKKGTFRSDPHL